MARAHSRTWQGSREGTLETVRAKSTTTAFSPFLQAYIDLIDAPTRLILIESVIMRGLIGLILIAPLFLACGPAMAARSKAGITAVFIGGKCVTFDVGGVHSSCKSIVYTNYHNGRIDLSIPSATGMIGFSGDHDIQPTLSHYILVVDTVLNEGANRTQKIPAKGRCVMNISPDGKFVHSIKCNITSEIGNVTLDFIGSNRPVTIKDF